MSFKDISYEIKDSIGYIGFGLNEKKSMTTLSANSLEELKEAVDKAADDSSLKALIFHSHKPGCFLAGMDISVINSLKTEEEAAKGAQSGQEIFNRIEDLKIPTACLVDGTCLGGGLELALSCNQIIASNNSKTRLGLPEVKLGVLPGFGGTYRLPRKIGLPASLDLILAGKMVNAKKAKKLKLVSHVVPAEKLLSLGSEYVFKKIIQDESVGETLKSLATDNIITRKIIFQKAKESVLKNTKGHYPAPLKILEIIEEGQGKPRSEYLAMECKAFGELSQTSESQSLQSLFFMMDESKKMDVDKETLLKVKKGAVVGAGTMGGGIAWLFADNHQQPIMKDISHEALELGLKQSSKNFKGALKRRKMTKDQFEKKQRSIQATLNFEGFNRIDLTVEAVVEDMGIKKKVLSELESHLREDSLLTTNTSSLSVTEMATALKRSDKFAGLHFFNPVHRMPLVEIIRHPETSDHTINSLYNWCLKVNKTPVVVNDGPGFLVNRILMPQLNESCYLLSEGVSIEDLDKAMLNFGTPMGPCRLMDEVGIDVLVKVSKVMENGLGARAKANEINHKIADLGFLGKKSSKGFYLYENGKQGEINPNILTVLPSENIKLDEALIQKRVVYSMINEAASILEDGIVDSAQVVDLGMIFGTGFPAFRGGLLRYADSVGLDKIVESLEEFAEKYSKDRFTPNAYLKKLASEKKKFYEI